MIGSTISSWALLIAETLEERGLSSRELFERVGMDHDLLLDPDARYPFIKMTELWNAASEAVNDPCFGFAVVKHLRPTSLHALGFAWLASTTLREAFGRLAKYSRLISDASVVDLRNEAGKTIVTIRLMEGMPPGSEHSVDAAVATMIRICRASYGDSFAPTQARFTHPVRDCFSAYRTWFNCEALFETDEDGIVVPNKILDERLPASNAQLAYANEQVIHDYFAANDRDGIEASVRYEVVRQLSGGAVSIESVARELGVSSRTLQRNLRDAGTSFRSIFEDTRMELAIQYVEASNRTFGEISFLLGYSDISNFTRAFRRSIGMPPTEFRTRKARHGETSARAGKN